MIRLEFGCEERITNYLAAYDENEVAADDIVDDITGEVIWEKGQRAGDCYRHPTAVKAREDAYRELVKPSSQKLAEAIAEYAGNYSPDSLDDLNVKPEHAAPDIAESFLYVYPWREWAEDEGMTGHDVLAAVTDAVFERLTHI